jgi:uncharacterized protein YjiK
LLLILLGGAGACEARRFAGGLELERVVAVAGEGDFQPSGLVVKGGRLFTVSDKNSEAVLEIPLDRGGEVTARRALAIAWGEGDRGNLDLEGLALDGAGDFVVVSEARARVFAVGAGGRPRWLDLDLAEAARRAGLLATAGAGFEGVAALGASRMVVAVERQPRGLVVATGGSAVACRMDATIIPLPPGRQPDFADLAVHGGRLFALVRNADAIVELVPDGAGFREGRWWSFGSAVAAHRYSDERFGMAEGLAIDDERVYVILDNNGSPRATAPEDRRPLLFVFRRPDFARP